MSSSKHMTLLAVIAIILAVVITVVCCSGVWQGIIITSHAIGYENRLFDATKVHTFDIVIDDWDTFLETCTSEEYSVCTVIIDGEKMANVGIRGKGNTSLSNVSSMDSSRYSFKVEFDQYENGKTYHGLDKLCLNNIIQDNTYMKDYVAYQLMGQFGVDAPLCSYAYITVNGEDWGLYLAVEGIEESFLQRNYGNSYGELYKPDSLSFGGGRGNGKDFNMDDFDFDALASSTDFGALFASKNNADNATGSSLSDKSQSGDDNSLFNMFLNNSGGMNQQNPAEIPQGGFGGNNFPDMPQGGFGDNTPQNMPQGNSMFGEVPQEIPDGSQMSPSDNGSTSSDTSVKQDKAFGGMGGFGMGSDDVKLKYIDDNASSYENIFSSAKTNVTEADQARLISSLKDLSDYVNLENVLDTEEVLRYFVVHNFLVNGDSYTGSMIHNYYLYEEDGKLSMIPWDYNLSFGTFQGNSATSSVNDPIDDILTDRPMQAWIFSNDSYTAQYHALYAEFLDSTDIEGLIENTYQLIASYVEKDPTKFCTYDEFEQGVATIKEFCNLRIQSISGQLSGAIPSTSELQKADNSTLIVANSLNLQDMGTMSGGGKDGGGGMSHSFGKEKMSSSNNSENQHVDGKTKSGNMSGFDPSKMQNGDFGQQPPSPPENSAGVQKPPSTN